MELLALLIANLRTNKPVGKGPALFRAALALTVSIDLSASDGDGGQKATTSARSGRRSGGCYAFEKRAKPDAESDDFGAAKTDQNRQNGQSHTSTVGSNGPHCSFLTFFARGSRA